jgi:hypothetical protein
VSFHLKSKSFCIKNSKILFKYKCINDIISLQF